MEQICVILKPYYGCPFPYYDKMVAIEPSLRAIETHPRTSLVCDDQAIVPQTSTPGSSTSAIWSHPPHSSSFNPASSSTTAQSALVSFPSSPTIATPDLQQGVFPSYMPSLQPSASFVPPGNMPLGPTNLDSSAFLFTSTEFPETYTLDDKYEPQPSASSPNIPSPSSQSLPTINTTFDLPRHSSSGASSASGSPRSLSHPYHAALSRRSSRQSSLRHEVTEDANIQEDEITAIKRITKQIEATKYSLEDKALLLVYFTEKHTRVAAAPTTSDFLLAYFDECLKKARAM